jgi:maltose-binding protein MalE
MKTSIFFLMICSLVACKNLKNTTISDTSSSSEQAKDADTNFQFIVSFISTGSGIDKTAKKQFEQFITEFENTNKLKLNVVITKWGREGEVNYCFVLKELNRDLQNIFITNTKSTLSQSNLIRFHENNIE